MKRLTKRDVETLLAGYDRDPIGSLTIALRIVLGRPSDDFDALIACAHVDDDRRLRLLRHSPDALDDLAAELNERRTL